MLYAAGQPAEKKEEEEEREGEENEKKIKRSDQCRMKSAGKTWRKAVAPSKVVSLTLDDALGECNHGREGLGDREGQCCAAPCEGSVRSRSPSAAHTSVCLWEPTSPPSVPPPGLPATPSRSTPFSRTSGCKGQEGLQGISHVPGSSCPVPSLDLLAPPPPNTHRFVYFLQQRRIPGNRAVTIIATPKAHETQTHLRPHTR